MRIIIIRIIRMKNITIPRGRTCTRGGSVCEEGRAAPLSARAQAGAALRWIHSELTGSRKQDADYSIRERKKSAVPLGRYFCIYSRCNVSSSERFGATLRALVGGLCS